MYKMSRFGERLGELIFDSKITVSQLAKNVGVARTTLYRYLSNSRVPTVNNVIRLANYFACSVDFLIGRDSDNYTSVAQEKLPEFSDRLLEILKKAGKTRYMLAKETKIDESVIHWWIKGNRKPTLDSLIKITEILNCSIDYLLGREN